MRSIAIMAALLLVRSATAQISPSPKSTEHVPMLYNPVYKHYYQDTVRETHSNIQVNGPIAPDAFLFVPQTDAQEVHDLTEGDEDAARILPGREIP